MNSIGKNTFLDTLTVGAAIKISQCYLGKTVPIFKSRNIWKKKIIRDIL